ncbi:MAG TPA: SgcJ/EcaC family oxidoreductase [Gemmatimonadota bacterium]|nr:SgcJ/EcaC family oxidoreductase [Gemmatimonadota bacterium]
MACEGQAPERLAPTPEPAATDSPAPPASGAEAEIRSLNDRYVAAIATGDTAAIVHLFAEDAVILVHNAPPVAGRDGVRRFYADFFVAIPDAAMTLVADTIAVAGSEDLAYEIARYTVTGTAPGGIRWEDRGRYLFALRPGSGGWRIAVASVASETTLPGRDRSARRSGGESAGADAPTRARE